MCLSTKKASGHSTKAVSITLCMYIHLSQLYNFFNSIGRHGNCVPYRPQERESLCDRFYTPGVDFVYVPYDRIGDFYLILDSLIESMVLTQSIFEDCNGPIMEVFCHFLFPPCGNVSVFEPPTSVCEDVCHYMDGVCSEQLQQLLETLEQMRGVIIGNTIVPPEEAGLTPINCSNTGEYLEPLPHCCSNAGVEIRKSVTLFASRGIPFPN